MTTYFKKIEEALYYYMYLLPFKLKNQKLNSKRKVISIFSNPRGGSTWLTDIISSIPGSSVVWEPLFKYNNYKINKFNPFSYSELEKVGFVWNQPIPDNVNWVEAEFFFDKLFKQQIINLKLYRYNKLSEVPQSDTFIYKFCYGNLMLPWLTKNYDINAVLLIRHPCAVVASQMRRGWDYTKEHPQYHINNFRYNDIYLQYKHIFDKINTFEEHLAANWAITNLIPIKHKDNDKKWITVSYENLIKNPQNEVERIFSRLRIDIPEGINEKIIRPSFTTDNSELFMKPNQLSKWEKVLSAKQIDSILNIVNKFGIDFYGRDLEPNYSNIYKY